MSYKVAVVGATGNVGRAMLDILAERNFPTSEVVALASRASIGKEVSYGDEDILIVKALDDYDFSDTDIALFSPGSAVSKIFAPKAAEAGCVVIDNTSYFRMMEDIPLIVPEVNSHALKNFRKKNIIANPNCSTAQMVVALKPLHDAAKIKRVVVSTYQSVSGAGKEGMDELYDQTKSIYMNDPKEPKKFTKRIAFNVIPHIDVFMEDGSTKEEWKMVEETKKIMEADIQVCATCVRVPVFVGHSESVNIEFEKPITAEQARDLLEGADGITMYDDHKDGGYCSPMECAGEDAVFISRLRQDTSVKHGLAMWIVSDNLRKGAALNAVQIAEALIEEHGLAPKKKN
ncbi:MAG: aspartate-semialdehyde dehydrogenase [Rickettsiales bacterium]|jgi:aspartate-semialdehyde dehydrogenase|nr:aspartate-semialdehyde dehydrogenase [Rickettsiales bacterium]